MTVMIVLVFCVYLATTNSLNLVKTDKLRKYNMDMDSMPTKLSASMLGSGGRIESIMSEGSIMYQDRKVSSPRKSTNDVSSALDKSSNSFYGSKKKDPEISKLNSNHNTLLLKSGRISLDVPNLSLSDGVTFFNIAPSEVEATMYAFGGKESYISATSQYTNNIHMTLRVPVDTFDEVFGALQGLVGNESSKLSKFGEVTSASKNVIDVTEEFIDRSARKSALETTHKRLEAVLNNATEVKDIVAVHRELNRLSGEIESQSARLSNLERKAIMSVIELSIHMKHILPPQPKLSLYERCWKSIEIPFNFLSSFIIGFIQLLLNLFTWLIIVIIPLGLIAFIIIYCFKDFFAALISFASQKLVKPHLEIPHQQNKSNLNE